jgi:hypothetical protein
MDPGCVAAAFRHRRNASVLLQLIGGVAVALSAEGDEETRGEDGSSAWEGVKYREVGMALGALRAMVAARSNLPRGHPIAAVLLREDAPRDVRHPLSHVRRQCFAASRSAGAAPGSRARGRLERPPATDRGAPC